MSFDVGDGDGVQWKRNLELKKRGQDSEVPLKSKRSIFWKYIGLNFKRIKQKKM